MSIQKAYESYGNNLIGAGGGGGSFSQIQSDWNESDNTEPDYIKNKPDVPSDAGDLDYDNTSSGLSATKVQGAIDELAKPTPKVIYDMGAWKNGLGNRGKDITSYLTDGTLWKRIAGTDGFEPFEDIFLGDIIDLGTAVTAPNSSVTGDSKIIVLEFNPCGYYQLIKQTYNHIAVCPLTHFGQAAMNDTATTAGGYAGSKMQMDILGYDVTTAGTISMQLYNILGTHLKKTLAYLTDNMNENGNNRTGSSTGRADGTGGYKIYARIMSEIEVLGSIVFSSSGYDIGSSFKQYPAFRNNKDLIVPKDMYYSFNNIASKTSYSGIVNANAAYGVVNVQLATTKRYVRPCFILG